MQQTPGEMKAQALADFATHVNPMKVRTLKSAGIDIVEEKREGACTWDITGARYIDCQTGSGIMNVGRRNQQVVDALKSALETYDIGVFKIGRAHV